MVDSSEETGASSQSGRANDEDIRFLIENIEDYAIFFLDPEGRVTSWTKTAERLHGYQADEILGQYFSVFYPVEDVQHGKPDLELKMAAGKGRFEDEGWRLRKDGSRFWANVIIMALRDEDGRVRGFGKISRDLIERMRAEEALRRMRDELEERISERTAELEKTNKALEVELSARTQFEQTVRALSTPVLPVRKRLLILPLIGVIDSPRALQFTEQLLNAIRAHRAEAVVMDITGVPVVDTRVANHLLQTIEAARLMGAFVIVTGISSEIAQTLVRIGVDLGRLETRTDLMGGLEEAERRLGYRIQKAEYRPGPSCSRIACDGPEEGRARPHE